MRTFAVSEFRKSLRAEYALVVLRSISTGSQLHYFSCICLGTSVHAVVGLGLYRDLLFLFNSRPGGLWVP